MTRYDVAVVGSGPAGSCAAVRLAEAGAKTVLLEKASLPRYKTCGGGVVGRCVRWLPIELGPVAQRECRRVAITFPDLGISVDCVRDHPIISMVMRDQFDMTLAGRAQEAGADLMTECPVVGVDQARTKTTLRCGRRTVHADFVVAADGATGPVVRTLGWARRHRAAPALEAEVTVSPALLDQLADTARFDIGYLPFGYAWIFPKLRHLSIGVLCTRPPSRPLSEYLAAYLKARGIDGPRSVTRHGYVIPLVPVDPPYVRGRSLVVGDAAGFADPVTAEGISFAVLTGQLAARAIIDGAMNGGSVRRSYHAALRRRVISELRVARLYAKVLYGSMGGRENILRQYGAGVAQVLVDVFSGATTYREALATPNLLRQLRAVWTGVAA